MRMVAVYHVYTTLTSPQSVSVFLEALIQKRLPKLEETLIRPSTSAWYLGVVID